MGGGRSGGGGGRSSMSRHRRKNKAAPPKNQVPHKFAVDEKVLCYEPDCNKARVLYDSKVLEVVERNPTKDKITVEYKIHFFGWNSSWDRYVAEDCVLKDTDENRALQKELKAKADELLQGHIKKKKRKKTLSELLKEATKGKTETSAGDNDDASQSSLSNESSDQESSEDEEDKKIVAQIMLTEAVQTMLEIDYYNIQTHSMLVRIPAEISVVYILEEYVKYLGFRELRKIIDKRVANLPSMGFQASASSAILGLNTVGASIKHQSSKTQSKASSSDPLDDITKVIRKVRQAKEVVGGLKTIFDFTLYQMLLYEVENEQYMTYKRMQPRIPMIDCTRLMPQSQSSKTNCDETSRSASVEEKKASKGAATTKKHIETHRTTDNEPSISSKGTTVTGGSSSNNPKLGAESFLWAKKVDQFTKDLIAWRLLPLEYFQNVEPDPCMVYGLIHLLRMCVKLPQVLNSTLIPRRKIRIIIHHVNQMLEHIQNTYVVSTHRMYFKIPRFTYEEDQLGFGAVVSDEDIHPPVKVEVDTDLSQYCTRNINTSNLEIAKPQLPKVVEVPLSSTAEALEEHRLTVCSEYVCKTGHQDNTSASLESETLKRLANSDNNNSNASNANIVAEVVHAKPLPPVIKQEPHSPPAVSPAAQKVEEKPEKRGTEKRASSPISPMVRKMRKSAADSVFKTAHIFANASSRTMPIATDKIKREPVEMESRKRALSSEPPTNKPKRVTRASDRSTHIEKSVSDDVKKNVTNSRLPHRSQSPGNSSKMPSKSSQAHEASACVNKPKQSKYETLYQNKSGTTPRKTDLTKQVCKSEIVVKTNAFPKRSPSPLAKRTSSPRSSKISPATRDSGPHNKSPLKTSPVPSTTLRLRSRSDERQLRSKGTLINALSLPMQASSRSSFTSKQKEERSAGRAESGIGRRESENGRRGSDVGRRESSGGSRESGGGRRESGGGRRESGGGRRESGGGRRESGGGSRESGGGSRESGGGRRESESGRRESESGKRELSCGIGRRESDSGRREIESRKREPDSRKKDFVNCRKESDRTRRESGNGKKDIGTNSCGNIKQSEQTRSLRRR